MEIRVVRKCSWEYRISDPDGRGIRSLEQGDSSGLEGVDGRALGTVDSESSETRVGLAFTSNALRRERKGEGRSDSVVKECRESGLTETSSTP